MEPLLTREQVADILGVSVSTVRRRIDEGSLRAVLVGPNLTRIEPADLRAFQASVPCIEVKRRHSASGVKGGGVYFLLAPSVGLTKIGFADRFVSRINDLQAANPEELQVVALLNTDRHREAERWFHRHFRKYRVRFEWFKITQTQIEAALGEWAHQ